MEFSLEFFNHPILCCFCYSFSFIGSIYFCGLANSRNHPVTIKNRCFSVALICCVILLHISTFIREPHSARLDLSSYEWKTIFIRFDNFLPAVSVAILLTLVLYLGSIVDQLCSDPFDLINFSFWKHRLFSLTGARNFLVAPASEELIFRACIVFHLQPLFKSCTTLCIISPLFFSVAHFHHLFELVVEGEQFRGAFIVTLFQVCYTTLFGAYSSFLLLKTGNVASSIAAHIICNFMGLPDLFGAVERGKLRWGLWGQLLAIFTHVAGIFLWYHLLYSIWDQWPKLSYVPTCRW